MNAYMQRLESDFAKHFGLPKDIPQPDPLAEVEASEGVCAMGDDDAQ